MATYWSVEDDDLFGTEQSTTATLVLSLDDVEPATASVAATLYILDYSLMAIVFGIILFLWMH